MFRLRRLTVLALILVIASAWTTYVAVRLRVTYRMQTEITELQIRLQALQSDFDAQQETQNERLRQIDRAVFGEPMPAPAPTTSVGTPAPSKPFVWQRNRDAELRKRLDSHERWRLEITQEVEALKRRLDARER